MTKVHDIVVYGATGYTGALVTLHLARTAEKSRFAIAGRDERKLRDLAARVYAESGYEPPILVASSEDRASLAAMCRSTHVVVACAGPFARLGEPVVAACVDEKCDYVDITGEPEFVVEIIRRHDERARRDGVRLVPCCGFDCVPADLGVWVVMDALRPTGPVSVESFVHINWDVSGGTWQTTLDVMSRSDPLRTPELPRAAPSGRAVHVSRARPRFEPEVSGWLLPAPTIDPAVVARSAAELDVYGPDFSYAHYFRAGSLPRAAAIGGALGTIFTLSRLGSTRKLLARMKPSGEGASEEERARGFFRVTTVARTAGERVVARASGGDKYAETGTMAAEAGLALAHDRARLPARAGVLTPAVAFGGVLVERLARFGVRFEIVRRTREAA